MMFLRSLINWFCGPQPQQPSASLKPPGVRQKLDQSNAYYGVNLRERANQEGRGMARCFEESRLLYSRGNKAGAKALSNEGKKHQRNMESLNKEASDWIFLENNLKDTKDGEIDLHGLYVKEALERTDHAIQNVKERGGTELRIIVGKGLHSSGGSTKIRPAVEELMEKHHLRAVLDAHNLGVLVVQINSDADRGIGANEISRRLERDEGCIVM